MAYNDRIPTLAEQELDYEQANMWYGDGVDGCYYGVYDGGAAFGGGGFGRGYRSHGMGHAGRGGMGGHAAGHGGGGLVEIEAGLGSYC